MIALTSKPKIIEGTLPFLFVFDADIVVAANGRNRRVSGFYRDFVPIQPKKIAASDLALAIHVEAPWSRGSSHDRVLKYNGQLYRRLECEEEPVPVGSVLDGSVGADCTELISALSKTPLPPSALAPRYGLRPYFWETMGRANERAGWVLRQVEMSNRDERWNEAAIHYHDAFLACGDDVYVRCAEPAWRHGTYRAMYTEARSPCFAHTQFGIDRAAELVRYVKDSTNVRIGDFELDAVVHHLDWESDDGSLMLDLGREVMEFVPRLKQSTTVAIREERGCRAAMDDLEKLYHRKERFTSADARLAIDEVANLWKALHDVIRLRQFAHNVGATLSRTRSRIQYIDDRLHELSADDREALQGI